MTDRFLEGRVAVVTGGTKGIGRAIAWALAEAGANVAIGARTAGAPERVAGEIRQELAERVGAEKAAGQRIAGARLDAGNSAGVTKFFEFVDTEVGGVDVLVNNAGIGIFGSTASLSVEQWDSVIATNLSGAFYASREALARFRQRGGGTIINVSSLAGKNPFAGGAAYNASKFGLNGFSEAMMLDHRQENVRVSYIMPGSVDTEFGKNSTGASWKIAPEDIAEIALMLLRMPSRTLVSRVEVRPSRPGK
jgi:3-oxoacyl-[acyl-carrier protein] reductase